MSYGYGKRRGTHIIDERFEGRSLELYTIDGEKLMGLVDEVALHEIGMYVENTPIIVSRNAILYVSTGLSDIHGVGECCDREFVLDEEFIGCDVAVRLINGQEFQGRLLKVTRYEIGIAQTNRALIIPRSMISHVRILRR